AEASIYGNSEATLTGKLLIYFRKDSSFPDLKSGSVLIIRKPLEKIPANHNPGGFDYSRYNALKGIYHQVFLVKTDYSSTGINDGNFLEELILSLQKNVLYAIRTNVRKEEQGLAEALLIGYKEDLNRELLQQYSNTGVVHVIAISGLHLALIYVLIEKVCSFFIRRKTLLKAVIILAGLWIFTLLAGASPSVVRSAVMFSMIVIGETFQKRSGITNSLFASAFLLLCYNPYWLWDLGFQLSYCAVLGLVLSAKPIYDLLYIQNKLIDQLWKMCSVTLAAQLFTLPILLYHFHQFPVYFLFTNFFCVPLSSLILVFEILLCAISFLSPVAMITGIVISWLIRMMNSIVSFFNDLPYTTIYPIQVNAIQAWMVTLLIGSLYFYFSNRTRFAIWFSFLAIIIFSIEHIKWKRRSADQSMLIVYNAGKYRAVDIISGNHSIFVTDTALLDPKLFKQFIEPTRNLYGVNNHSILIYPASNGLLTTTNKKIALINRKNYSINSSGITIFSRNSFEIDTGSSIQHYGDIILDGTNSAKKISEWNTVPAWVPGKLHQTSKEGAFVKSFN
ncbi:MAG: ComEC/Rec2 family competence protein, partial [Flavitalea sp.]